MMRDLVQNALNDIHNTIDSRALENCRIHYLGKNGIISLEMRKISNLTDVDKKSFGEEINKVKNIVVTAIEEKFKILKQRETASKLASEKLDVTMPSRKRNIGSIHPITQATQEIIEICTRLGFDVKNGPNIEDEWHNFTALNIPPHHPARQMHDTFYLAGGKLLRTHTSPVQIRAMMSSNPPFRFIAPGRVYRCDSDMTHTPVFHQIEVLAIDRNNVTMGHLIGFIRELITQFFERNDVEIRLRPSFFPFTSPSAEVDIKMRNSDKWLEVLGCGMVHPNILKNVNMSDEYYGFALGMGVERFAMLKYGIDDLRQMFDGDQRWLKHYSFSAFDIPTLAGGLTK